MIESGPRLRHRLLTPYGHRDAEGENGHVARRATVAYDIAY